LGKISLAPKALKGVIARKAAAKGVLSGFGRAVLRAERSGNPVRMTVIVEPHSMSPRIAVEDVTSPARDELDVALIAAKMRGAARVVDILKRADMLTADAFTRSAAGAKCLVWKDRGVAFAFRSGS
jgi:hypothetical protein